MPTQTQTLPILRHTDNLCRLIGTAVTIAILVGGISIDSFLATQRSEMTELRKAAEAITAQGEAVRRKCDALRLERDTATMSLDELRGRLEKTPLESQFNASLAAAAAASGMKIESFRPGQRFVTKGLGELEVQVSCRGGYAAHCDFLEKLRSFSRVCPVTSMNIAATDNSGVELQSEFQIRLIYGDAAALATATLQGASQ